MDWNKVISEVSEYVETHLQRDELPIEPQEIAAIANCSFGFFQKVFSYLNDISFADYLRYRKLTLAGYDLKATKSKVTDISYKYGYDSSTSFTKAFRKFHGCLPSAAYNEKDLSVYPRLGLHQKCMYKWRKVKVPSFRLIGVSRVLSMKDGTHYKTIPNFWKECQDDGTFLKLVSLDEAKTQGIFGVMDEYNIKEMTIRYSIMVISTAQIPESWSETLIPDNIWATFDCLGEAEISIQKGWEYLNKEWMVEYPFDHAFCPELEWYSGKSMEDENYLSQIWIPIIEKE